MAPVSKSELREGVDRSSNQFPRQYHGWAGGGDIVKQVSEWWGKTL